METPYRVYFGIGAQSHLLVADNGALVTLHRGEKWSNGRYPEEITGQLVFRLNMEPEEPHLMLLVDINRRVLARFNFTAVTRMEHRVQASALWDDIHIYVE